jgi:Family of unknown function (DUF6527)
MMFRAFLRSLNGAWRWARTKRMASCQTGVFRSSSGDSLPPKLPKRDLILAREDDEDWCVGMRCPCGCDVANIELLVIPEAKPRWDVSIDANQRPTFTPSVWVQRGRRSHFWLRGGRVQWCE